MPVAASRRKGTGCAMTAIEKEHGLGGGRVLRVVHGDITQESVDAIVNAANGWLAHGGGVAGAILRRAGLDLQLESDAWVDRTGEIPNGGVAHTTAGMLRAKRVIHAVGPIWRDGRRNEPAELREAVTNSLKLADELGLARVSFPAISSGIFGFPKDLCAEIMVDATVAYFDDTPLSKITEVRFTNIDRPTVDTFCAEFARRFEV